jgi:hypothetical protein
MPPDGNDDGAGFPSLYDVVCAAAISPTQNELWPPSCSADVLLRMNALTPLNRPKRLPLLALVCPDGDSPAENVEAVVSCAARLASREETSLCRARPTPLRPPGGAGSASVSALASGLRGVLRDISNASAASSLEASSRSRT